MLDTVVISDDDVCCSVMFGTLVGVFVFSDMWSELKMTSAVNSPLWSHLRLGMSVVIVFVIVICLVLLMCTLII